MKRIGHDLAGVTQRIARLNDQLAEFTVEAEQIWRDEKAKLFFGQHIAPAAPALSQLVSSLTQSIELFEDIARKVQDPEDY